MARELDILASLLRSTARSVAQQLRRLQVPPRFRRVLQDALMRRVTLKDEQLTAATGQVPGISEVTVSATAECLRIDARLDEGSSLVASLIPEGAVFAPRGAKEVSFRVEPGEVAASLVIRNTVAAIAALMARTVWGPLLPRQTAGAHLPFVERDGARLRVDLRTVPEVRNALRLQAVALAIDALDVRHVACTEDGLQLTLGVHGVG